LTIMRLFLTACLIFCTVFQANASSYKVMVDEDGIYAITPDLLRRAGADLEAADPRKFSMTNKGREIPVYVSGESDGRFDGTDYIEFYGERYKQGEYTNTNVYWLSWDGKPGPRIVEEDASLLETRQERYKTQEQGFRQKVRFEVDNGRFQKYTSDDNTVWFWIRLNAPGLSQIPFDLSNVSDSLETGSVRVMLHGSGNTRHNMEVFLNAGFRLGEISWLGQENYLLEKNDVPNYIFNEGQNAIGIYYSPDAAQDKPEQVLLDWIEIEYWRDYAAHEDYLEFSNPQNQDYGLYQFEVRGFSSPEIEIFKLSPDNGIQGISKLTDGHIESKGGGYNLTFQDTIVQPTRYIALNSDQIKSPLDIKEDASSNLRSENSGADYIVITHKDFHDSAVMLAEFRADQGMRTKVADVEDVYDEFSHGIFDPNAIRDFIRYAFHNWQIPAPQYVLLLGDASWWYRRDESYVPSHTYNSKVGDPGSEWGPTASDDYFICVSGDDPIPDLCIGRIPAKTAEEAQIAAEKIIKYEKSPEPGQWLRSLLFLSGRQPEEPKLIFEKKAEEFIDRYIPSDYSVSRLYTNPDSQYSGDTSDLINAIDEGRSFIRFAGHGGGSVWSDDDLLALEDISSLRNGGKLPFITSWTCFTAWFDNPYANCLGEDLLFLKDGGAVALLGATGLGLLYADFHLEEEVYKALFVKNERVLGRVIVEAKTSFLTRFAGRRDYADLAATYMLIGDPATRLILPVTGAHTPILPDLVISSSDLSPIQSGYTVSVAVHNAGAADAHDVTVNLYDSNPFREITSEIGFQRIASIPIGGTVTVSFSYTPEKQINSAYIWIDPADEIPEANESNNMVQLEIKPNMSLITPETGSNGQKSSTDGIFLYNIPAGTVLSQTYLTITEMDIPQFRDTQPDISYAPLPGKNGGAYWMELLPEPDLVEEESISISFKYDAAALAVGETEKLAIYRRLGDVDRWIICHDCIVNDGVVSTEVSQPGIYALLINNDLTAPELNLTLKDQGFMNEDFVSSNPQVSILAEDANGIKDVQVFLNGALASPEELSASGTTGLTPFSVEYHPVLSRGSYTVEVEAHDLNGLSASRSLILTVEPEFRIEDIANRPNPCSRRTLFTYILTQPADEMTIKIYSTSGRLIKKLDAPASAGYNELLWNLRDEDDRAIANGAYFYKLTAKREGRKTERIGKLAVLK